MADKNEPPLPEWGPGKTAKGRARLPSSRHRARPTLSCSLCRRRKIRCDRQQPCSTCKERGLAHACAYPTDSNSPSANSLHRPRPPTVQDRIQQLENLVVDLMHKASASGSDPDASVASTPSSPSLAFNHGGHEGLEGGFELKPSPGSDFGSVQVTGSAATYVSSAHWAAVLDGIAELKDQFDSEGESDAGFASSHSDLPSHGWTGPRLLYGCSGFLNKEEILASIPDRAVVDGLVSRYFNTFEVSPAVLHTVQFLREYEEFWENPSAASPIWLGLLFSILCLAAHFQKFRLDPSIHTPTTMSMGQELSTMAEAFRTKIAQCLVLGNYEKGGAYVLETLLLYLCVEIITRKDAEVGVWMLLGSIVQLAMYMGYHRDPKHFKGISPFDGEMRRRVWATVVEIDLVMADQMGQPRLIKQWQTDTALASNLHDSDFGKDAIEMPASRPETDMTPILYRIVKSRIMASLGHVYDFVADIRTHPYSEVTKMDKRLQDAHSSIPKCFEWVSMAQCITDSPTLIIQKMFFEMIIHGARIVLHRRYLHCSPTKAQYAQSQQVCVDQALKLLEYQHMLREATQPFCQLYQERWRVTSPLNHVFLLATSVLCSYLHSAHSQRRENNESEAAEAVLKALKRSHDIWLHSSDSSKEARKAAKALSVLLGKQASSASASDSGTGIPVESNQEEPDASDVDNYQLGDPAEFDMHFPAFDIPGLSTWPVMNRSSLGELEIPAPASDLIWENMDAVDSATSPPWPWNLS